MTVEPTDGVRLAALTSLEHLGSRRLAALLATSDVVKVFDQVQAGRVPSSVVGAQTVQAWKLELAQIDLEELASRMKAADIWATHSRCDDHPAALVTDIDPAPVLFGRGRLPDPGLPHVAIVGTRRCSGVGKEVAFGLGADLAAAGVCVVSGLALGVDGAAHSGAVSVQGAPPLAVVGGGPDVIYPKRHASLWSTVIERGAVVAETPPGGEPTAWRFPARNRLIAAFADLIVVVESRDAGGSLITVDEAIRRGIDVMAVPGSVRNAAANGTNQLLVDGCAPVRSAADVLMALGLDATSATARRDGQRPLPTGDGATVLASVDDGPTSTETIIDRSGLPVRRVLTQLELLLVEGYIVTDGAKVRRA